MVVSIIIIIINDINSAYLFQYEYVCLFLEVIITTCDCVFQSVQGFPRYGYGYGIFMFSVYISM